MMVYTPEIVKELRYFYGDRLDSFLGLSIHEHLSILADRMLEGLNLKSPVILQEFKNYHNAYLGAPIADLINKHWKLKDAQHCIANEYGFLDWHEVNSIKSGYNHEFEGAVTDLLNGRYSNLKDRLNRNSQLAQIRSNYGHRATLLNYTTANGVEFWRQQVPYNLDEMVALLIECGADKNAKMSVYGGQFNTLQLLLTSAHPFKAGVVDKVKSILA